MPSLRNLASTLACVAIPAWSIPGSHKVSNPCIRFWRITMSWSVVSHACPMCNLPVTFGGGITIEYGLAFLSPLGLKTSSSSHSWYRPSSTALWSYFGANVSSLTGSTSQNFFVHPVSRIGTRWCITRTPARKLGRAVRIHKKTP